MNTFIRLQIQRFAQSSFTAYADRNVATLTQLWNQMEGFEVTNEDVFGWSLVKDLTRARLDFLDGNFQTSHIETLSRYVTTDVKSTPWTAQLLEELSTFELHYGKLENALEHLNTLSEIYMSQGLIANSLDAQLKRLHLMFVFESIVEGANVLLSDFEHLHQVAVRANCKSIIASTALFISKEYARKFQFQLALKWANKVIDGFIGNEQENSAQLEIAFLHRAEVYQSMGLTAASQMDIEASRWAVS